MLRAKCDDRRARTGCPPAGNAFACGICPATLICDVPLKKRTAILFGAGEAVVRAQDSPQP
jgi:hypothetical protein